MNPETAEFKLHESYWTRLEQLQVSDADDLHTLSVAVNWPHRPHDIEALIQLGQGVIARDTISRPLGSGMSFQYGPDTAMIGMMITHPKLQAGGLGREILAKIEGGLGDCRLRLNATRPAWRLYQSAGFRETGTVVQYQGLTTPIAASIDGAKFRLAELEDAPTIMALDRQVFGANRVDIISRLLDVSTVHVISQGKVVTGFAMCRPFGQGHLIGPLVAGSEADAITLVSSFAADHAGQFLRLDADARHKDLGSFLNKAGLENYDEIIPMVKGDAFGPENAPDHVYALSSQALG